MLRPYLFPRFALLGLMAAAAPVAAQVTESPATIAPGRVLVEVDGVKLSYERADAAGNKHTAVGVGSTIVSTGITSSLDVQVGFDLFLHHSFEFRGATDSRSGIGDVRFRTKWTFWRDEATGSAAAIIPFVKVPTNSGGVGNDSIEGGFILPWATGLGADLSAGAMLQWDMIRNDDDNGYDARWSLSGFLQHNLTRSFAVYGEAAAGATSAGSSRWFGSLGVGVLLHVTRFVQLDFEVQRGIGGRAMDWTQVFRVNWEW